MRKQLFTGLTFCLALLIVSCKSKETSAAWAPLKVETRNFNKKFCAQEDACATFTVDVPELTGGDSSVTKNVNHSIQSYILSTVGANESLPFIVAMDSAALHFLDDFKTMRQENPDMIPMGYAMEIKGSVPMLTSKVATMHLDGYSFMGGAHPNPFTTIVSYDLLSGGKALTVNSMISDTNAVRPLLETGYKAAKGMKPEDNIAELLYSELSQLPMPANVAVLPQGIIFYYNAYEVAAYAIGPTEIILTWEQLGTLADRKKWLD
jgi:Deacetylase PdaC/Protein of unknown function (DUF3298)